MSDRLYQNLIGAPLAELDEEILADDIASTVRALGRQADGRPLPVALDWSGVRIDIRTGPQDLARNLLITASAPVK